MTERIICAGSRVGKTFAPCHWCFGKGTETLIGLPNVPTIPCRSCKGDMKDTPRTDAVSFNATIHTTGGDRFPEVVEAAFARKLEHENDLLRAATEGALQGSGELAVQHAAFLRALQSIAGNSCCGPCRESGMVAAKVLAGKGPLERALSEARSSEDYAKEAVALEIERILAECGDNEKTCTLAPDEWQVVLKALRK